MDEKCIFLWMMVPHCLSVNEFGSNPLFQFQSGYNNCLCFLVATDLQRYDCCLAGEVAFSISASNCCFHCGKLFTGQFTIVICSTLDEVQYLYPNSVWHEQFSICQLSQNITLKTGNQRNVLRGSWGYSL